MLLIFRTSANFLLFIKLFDWLTTHSSSGYFFHISETVLRIQDNEYLDSVFSRVFLTQKRHKKLDHPTVKKKREKWRKTY